MSSKTQSFAEKELKILTDSYLGPDEKEFMELFVDDILSIVDKFGKSGQSGGSAPVTALILSDTIRKLLLQQPVAPLMGTDDEWVEVGDGVYQNNRSSAVFKQGKAREPYYLDAIIYVDEDGTQINGSALDSGGFEIPSRQYIKSFPFTQKTFYIDGVYQQVAPGDFQRVIKNEDQLKDVFEYYNRYEAVKSKYTPLRNAPDIKPPASGDKKVPPMDYPEAARVYASQIFTLGNREFKMVPPARHDELKELYRLLNNGKPAEVKDSLNSLQEAHDYLRKMWADHTG